MVFFTGSAPLTGKHINISPKGLPSSSFSILGPNLCAYIDATGSGCETISHVHENGRVTIMFCSFDKAPQIMRLFCTARVVEWDEPDFGSWLKRMGEKKVTAMRAVIILDVFKVQTSCGYAVPFLAMKPDPEDKSKQIPYLHDRDTLGHWGSKQIDAGTIDAYRAKNNSYSLDGLPGMRRARRDKGDMIWYSEIKARIRPRNCYWQMTAVAVLSALLTVLSLFMLDLMTVKAPEQWWDRKRISQILGGH